MMDDRARRNQTVILRQLQSVGQAKLAEGLHVSEATVSRWKAELEQTATALALLGLKVVPTTMRCFATDDVNALLHIARGRLAQMASADELAWEDEP